MNKIFLLIMVATILLSGCVDKTNNAVKIGDNISVDYTGSFVDGKVFDTSIKTVAQANNLTPRDVYEPLKFKVGQKPSAVIAGFDKGVIGMKKGQTRLLTIPPEEAYPINPNMIQVAPIVQDLPATRTIPRVFEIPLEQFEQYFGKNHLKGDIVEIPDAPFNTTVVDINETNITLRHNRIPDTTITTPGMFGQMEEMRISFNETSMIMDRNPEVAGKTLIFNVTLVSIDK
jgi:FKBP-type peptidyl-prolyl cis-trans isomerase 2